MLAAVLLLCAARVQGGREGAADQDWGYITVRPNAHMFWWLYYTASNDVSNYTERPLIIWLQGGPGMPSSGYGNFLEIGPLDASLAPRNGSFVENFNVLFVDNPVGVGYSHVSDESTPLVANGDEIGADLYNFLEVFMEERHSEFKEVPVYVFGESYGGKMATELVHAVAVKGRRFCNIKGLALGDAYISPVDYLKHYAPLALNLGLIDRRGFAQIDFMVKQTQDLINEKKYKTAASIENFVLDLFDYETFGIDTYNILAKTNSSRLPKVWEYTSVLESLMNNEVKEKLNIRENITWKFFGDDVYQALRGDLLKGVTDKVEALLNTTDVKIIVYNGILDFIVNTAGTISWLDSLNWKGREKWYDQNQTALVINEISEGYFKRVENLVFYAILRAGHSVPIDNLPVLNEIVQRELLN